MRIGSPGQARREARCQGIAQATQPTRTPDSRIRRPGAFCHRRPAFAEAKLRLRAGRRRASLELARDLDATRSWPAAKIVDAGAAARSLEGRPDLPAVIQTAHIGSEIRAAEHAAITVRQICQRFEGAQAGLARSRTMLLFQVLVLRAPFQRLVAFDRTPRFWRCADEFGGYDVTGLGRVAFNGP